MSSVQLTLTYFHKKCLSEARLKIELFSCPKLNDLLSWNGFLKLIEFTFNILFYIANDLS